MSNDINKSMVTTMMMEEHDVDLYEMVEEEEVEEVPDDDNDHNDGDANESDRKRGITVKVKETEDKDDDLLEFEASLALKKKKKKDKTKDRPSSTAPTMDDSNTMVGDREYTYMELLQRVTGLLKANNPALHAAKVKKVLPPPIMARIGSRRVAWVNYGVTCNILRRSPDHLKSFVLGETGSEGSINAQQQLIVRGKYLSKDMEAFLKKYILEYVTCHMCGRVDTSLSRDAVTRLHFCVCDTCGSRRAVAPITFYHATNRADRRAAQAATT